MTTPAVNRNNISLATRKSCQTRLLPSPMPESCSSTSVAVGWSREVRPASSSANFINGIRECKPWTHSGGQMRQTTHSYAWKHQIGSAVFQKTVTNPWGTGQTPTTPSPPGLNLLDRALVQAYNNVKDEKVNIGKFFAEAGQTLGMIETRVLRMAGAYDRFRRLYPADFQHAKRVMRDGLARRFWCDIPRRWLELQYGLKPLMSDITGGIDQLAAHYEKGALIFGEGKAGTTLTEAQIAEATDGWKSAVTWQIKQFVRVGLLFRLDNPGVKTSGDLGFLDPVGIVWEVRRFSFMVDWLIPIGPWLSALTTPAGLGFISGYNSRKSRKTFLNSMVVAGPSSGSKIGGVIHPPRYTGKLQSFVRQCYSSPPVPGLYVKSPISTHHIANALSLLAVSLQGP